jgi:hypothetical protein
MVGKIEKLEPEPRQTLTNLINSLFTLKGKKMNSCLVFAYSKKGESIVKYLEGIIGHKILERKNSKPFEIAASLRESRNRSRKKISKKENKNTIPLTQGNFKTSDSTEFVNSYEIKQDSLLKKNEKGKTVFNK